MSTSILINTQHPNNLRIPHSPQPASSQALYLIPMHSSSLLFAAFLINLSVPIAISKLPNPPTFDSDDTTSPLSPYLPNNTYPNPFTCGTITWPFGTQSLLYTHDRCVAMLPISTYPLSDVDIDGNCVCWFGK